MIRIKLLVAYDGTDFNGWARQPSLPTIQGCLEAALSTVFRSPITVTCAGRTDAGVHARGQVVHFDTEAAYEADLARSLNGLLPATIRIKSSQVMPAEFDARFAAIWRRYAYYIADSPELVDPLSRQQVLVHPRKLAAAEMNDAAKLFLGEHDFAAFCKKRPGATTIRRLHEFSWHRDAAGLLVGHIVADAFCHSMVRALVGCMVAVGEGQLSAAAAVALLVGKQRDPAITVFPARGLVLEEVGYPAATDYAKQTLRTRQVRSLD